MVGVVVTLVLGVAVALLLLLPLPLPVPLSVPVSEGVPLPDTVAVPLPVGGGERVGEGDTLGVALPLSPCHCGQLSQRTALFKLSSTYSPAAAGGLGTYTMAVAPLSCATPLPPTVLPATPVPTSVLTAPVEVDTALTLWLPLSATRRFPKPSSAKCHGPLKLALVPTESSAPATPAVPASVVTAPLARLTALTTAPVNSLTYRVLAPVASRHRPLGVFRLALVPLPSTVCATPEPTRVVTCPPPTTLTLWLRESAT